MGFITSFVFVYDQEYLEVTYEILNNIQEGLSLYMTHNDEMFRVNLLIIVYENIIMVNFVVNLNSLFVMPYGILCYKLSGEFFYFSQNNTYFICF